MAESIAVVNLKGGVGKTALAVNFAAYCGQTGKRTLLVDLDPQTNATFSCLTVDQWEEHAASHGTVANLFGLRNNSSAEGAEVEATDVICNEVFPGVDLIPSHLDLFTIDLDMASITARETKLRRALSSLAVDYEVIVCDCPPNLTIPTQNALSLCSHYVVPISPDFLSGLGVGLLLKRVRVFCEELEHDLNHAGIVISRVGRPALHRESTVEALRQTFKDKVFDTTIKERVVVSEAAASQKSIFQMSKNEAATEFAEVSEELIKRIGV